MAQSHVTAVPPADIAELCHVRFDRALAQLHDVDQRARVSLDTATGLANGVDGSFPVSMPPAARELPGGDRAAAAAVLFLDRYGPIFGIPGWHVLSPQSVSPLGRAIWFCFRATTADGVLTAHVCADEETVKHVRIER